jgi:hypothetical protein
MRTIDEILDKIKNLKGIKKDMELAILLNVKPNTITTWRTRKTIPHDVLYRFCEEQEIDITWLLTGKITTKYIDVEGQRVLVMSGEPGLYKKEEETHLKDAAKPAIYNNVKGDPELEEILRYFLENPQDKKFCLKVIRGSKEVKEGVEGFVSKKPLIEEE